MEKTKKCSKCKKNRNINYFYSDKTKPDGKRTTCKECHKISKVETVESITENFIKKVTELGLLEEDIYNIIQKHFEKNISTEFYISITGENRKNLILSKILFYMVSKKNIILQSKDIILKERDEKILVQIPVKITAEEIKCFLCEFQ